MSSLSAAAAAAGPRYAAGDGDSLSYSKQVEAARARNLEHGRRVACGECEGVEDTTRRAWLKDFVRELRVRKEEALAPLRMADLEPLIRTFSMRPRRGGTGGPSVPPTACCCNTDGGGGSPAPCDDAAAAGAQPTQPADRPFQMPEQLSERLAARSNLTATMASALEEEFDTLNVANVIAAKIESIKAEHELEDSKWVASLARQNQASAATASFLLHTMEAAERGDYGIVERTVRAAVVVQRAWRAFMAARRCRDREERDAFVRRAKLDWRGHAGRRRAGANHVCFAVGQDGDAGVAAALRPPASPAGMAHEPYTAALLGVPVTAPQPPPPEEQQQQQVVLDGLLHLEEPPSPATKPGSEGLIAEKLAAEVQLPRSARSPSPDANAVAGAAPLSPPSSRHPVEPARASVRVASIGAQLPLMDAQEWQARVHQRAAGGGDGSSSSTPSSRQLPLKRLPAPEHEPAGAGARARRREAGTLQPVTPPLTPPMHDAHALPLQPQPQPQPQPQQLPEPAAPQRMRGTSFFSFVETPASPRTPAEEPAPHVALPFRTHDSGGSDAARPATAESPSELLHLVRAASTTPAAWQGHPHLLAPIDPPQREQVSAGEHARPGSEKQQQQQQRRRRRDQRQQDGLRRPAHPSLPERLTPVNQMLGTGSDEALGAGLPALQSRHLAWPGGCVARSHPDAPDALIALPGGLRDAREAPGRTLRRRRASMPEGIVGTAIWTQRAVSPAGQRSLNSPNSPTCPPSIHHVHCPHSLLGTHDQPRGAAGGDSVHAGAAPAPETHPPHLEACTCCSSGCAGGRGGGSALPVPGYASYVWWTEPGPASGWWTNEQTAAAAVGALTVIGSQQGPLHTGGAHTGRTHHARHDVNVHTQGVHDHARPAHTQEAHQQSGHVGTDPRSTLPQGQRACQQVCHQVHLAGPPSPLGRMKPAGDVFSRTASLQPGATSIGHPPVQPLTMPPIGRACHPPALEPCGRSPHSPYSPHSPHSPHTPHTEATPYLPYTNGAGCAGLGSGAARAATVASRSMASPANGQPEAPRRPPGLRNTAARLLTGGDVYHEVWRRLDDDT